MPLTTSPTELTTAATDAALAILCIGLAAGLRRERSADRWKVGLWTWVLVLVACASCLGALAHGFIMADSLQEALWKAIYPALGVSVGLFFIGAVRDWSGQATAVRWLPYGIGAGLLAYAFTEVFHGDFLVFILYETAAMLGALALYARLAMAGRLRGAGIIAGAILLNIAAAGVQAGTWSLRIIVPFDHNGLFHLLQMAGLALLARGLRLTLRGARTASPYGTSASIL